MFMKMNVSYEQAEGYAGTDSIRNRPLQDLVPYSLNASVAYSGPVIGAAVNWGTTGRKLTLSGTEEKYDEYLAPRQVLDLQLSARLLKGKMEVKFNISDLLHQDFITYRNMGHNPGVKDANGSVVEKGDAWEPLLDDMNYNEDIDWTRKRLKKGSSYSFSVSYRF